jgi:hypothetical protein
MVIDLLAERYSQRPSSLLKGSWEDLQVDYAVYAAARAHREQLQDEQQRTPPPVDRSRYLSVRHLARSA